MTSPVHDSFDASKEVVEWLGEIPTPSTRKTYCSALFNYWQNSLSKDYPTLAEWIEAVKKERGYRLPLS